MPGILAEIFHHFYRQEGLRPMIYFDGHVHIQENVSIDSLLDSARRNFIHEGEQTSPGQSATCFLFLAETKKFNFFSDYKKQADARLITPGGWHLSATREAESLLLTHNDWQAGRIFLVAGRQIVTVERLEVLALATTSIIADGLSLDETVATIQNNEGLAVLPWAVGKWFGKRGATVDAFLKTAAPGRLFVGDNGGRPVFWPTPRLFLTARQRGIQLLPGSDPLPLAREELRVGSYGGWLNGECSDDRPAADIRKLLTTGTEKVTPFGERQQVLNFFRNQLALRLK
jgi:hypothetical protein